jgi:hypothetical protein
MSVPVANRAAANETLTFGERSHARGGDSTMAKTWFWASVASLGLLASPAEAQEHRKLPFGTVREPSSAKPGPSPRAQDAGWKAFYSMYR